MRAGNQRRVRVSVFVRPLLLTLIAVLLLPACAANRKRAAPELRPLVMQVKIKGGKAIKSNAIAPTLAQRATSPLAFVPVLHLFNKKYFLEGTTWEQDRIRIANYYALHGFFDAKVLGTQLLPGRGGRTLPSGEPRQVHIIHTVQEGEPTLFRPACVEKTPCKPPFTVSFQAGLRKDGVYWDDPRLARPPTELILELRKLLARDPPLPAGERFSMAAVDEAAADIRKLLSQRSYGRVQVTAAVDAYPEEGVVDVRYEVLLGPRARFGTHTIDGLDKVRKKDVARRIRFKEGAWYDGVEVAETQQRIYDMGVFSLVTLSPDLAWPPALEDDGTETLNLAVGLKERKPGSITGGPGVGFQRDRFNVYGGVALRHVNLFRRLVKGDLALKAGYAYLGPDDHFPIANLTMGLRWPDFPVRTLTLFGNAGIELGVEVGYKFWSPELEAGIAWAPLKPLRLSLSYSVAYFDLFPDERVAALQASGQFDDSDVEFEDGYFLSRLRQDIVLDLRDQPMSSNAGLFVRLVLDEAGGPLQGTYRYVKFTPDVRGYIPFAGKRIVLASRVWASYVHVWGDEHGVPASEAVYAGGDGSVRGWKQRYLGPRAKEGNCDRSDCIVPLGGRLGVAGSVELRGNPIGPLWVAGFTDFGRVWASPDDIADVQQGFDDLQFSVGGGIRLDTGFIGRIRLDFAVHPLEWTDPEFLLPLNQKLVDGSWEPAEPAIWNIHFGIGESF